MIEDSIIDPYSVTVVGPQGSSTVSVPVPLTSVSQPRNHRDHGYFLGEVSDTTIGERVTSTRQRGTQPPPRSRSRRQQPVPSEQADQAAADMYRVQSRTIQLKVKAQLQVLKQQAAYWMRKREWMEKQMEKEGLSVNELPRGLTDDTDILSTLAADAVSSMSEDENDRNVLMVLHFSI